MIWIYENMVAMLCLHLWGNYHPEQDEQCREVGSLYLQHTRWCLLLLSFSPHIHMLHSWWFKSSLHCIFCRVLLSGALKDWSKRLVLILLLPFRVFEFLKQYIFSCGSAVKGIGKGTRSRAEGNQVFKLHLCNDGASFCFRRFALCIKETQLYLSTCGAAKNACTKFRSDQFYMN